MLECSKFPTNSTYISDCTSKRISTYRENLSTRM